MPGTTETEIVQFLLRRRKKMSIAGLSDLRRQTQEPENLSNAVPSDLIRFSRRRKSQTSIANLQWKKHRGGLTKIGRRVHLFSDWQTDPLKRTPRHHGSASRINLLNYLDRERIGAAGEEINHTAIRVSQWVRRHREEEVTWVGLIEGVKNSHGRGKEEPMRQLQPYFSVFFLSFISRPCHTVLLYSLFSVGCTHWTLSSVRLQITIFCFSFQVSYQSVIVYCV